MDMPIIDGFMCKGFVEKDGRTICIEDDMSEKEREEFFRRVRNTFANSLLEIMYQKEKGDKGYVS